MYNEDTSSGRSISALEMLQKIHNRVNLVERFKVDKYGLTERISFERVDHIITQDLAWK